MHCPDLLSSFGPYSNCIVNLPFQGFFTVFGCCALTNPFFFAWSRKNSVPHFFCRSWPPPARKNTLFVRDRKQCFTHKVAARQAKTCLLAFQMTQRSNLLLRSHQEQAQSPQLDCDAPPSTSKTQCKENLLTDSVTTSETSFVATCAIETLLNIFNCKISPVTILIIVVRHTCLEQHALHRHLPNPFVLSD